jgi:hypothetical protein
MWIYLIIAAELGLFYTLFWFYFVREPQPFKVKGNPWGRYDVLTTGGAEEAYRKQQAQIRLARRRRCRKAAMSRAHLPSELIDLDSQSKPVFKRLLSMLGFSAAVS